MVGLIFFFTYLYLTFCPAFSRGVPNGASNNGFEVRNIREYYISAEKIEWNYLPSGKNMLDERLNWDFLTSGTNVSDFSAWHIKDTLTNSQNRIGSTYTKYVYKQYTNDSFQEEVTKPAWLGYVGPLIKGEVGEIIKVHFKNMADRQISMHPHGIRYDKTNEGLNGTIISGFAFFNISYLYEEFLENAKPFGQSVIQFGIRPKIPYTGAFYNDKTRPYEHVDETVKPGGTLTYTWKINADFAPSDDDPDCIPWSYHSHIDPDREVNSGLLGILLTCKQGTLHADGRRKDVDKEFVLYLDNVDETETWLIEENLKKCGDPAECKRLLDSGDADFIESNAKNTINGYAYANLPGLEACEGEKVAFYMFSLSKQYHPVHIHGQTFTVMNHRESVIGLWPATFVAAEMVPINPGRWILTCFNADHAKEGMRDFFTVLKCSNESRHEILTGNVRRYYLAAEEEIWDYGPSGQNLFNSGELTAPGSISATYFSRNDSHMKPRIGGKYQKARFHQYMDSSFTTRVNRTMEEEHMGILGPVIRAEVGDTLEIVLANRATERPYSIYLHGVSLPKNQDGTWVKSDTVEWSHSGNIVLPGAMDTYRYTIPYSLAPTNEDPQCLTYMYYSAVNPVFDIYSGLIGPLLICKHGALDPATGRQKYIDRNMFLYYASIDENQSWYIDNNIASYTNGSVDKEDEDFKESNIMRSINGLMYGNVKGLNVCKGDQVLWHTLSFGEIEGVHSPTFLGNNVMEAGMNKESFVMVSGLTRTTMMHPENLGQWGIVCHNGHHFLSGMQAKYDVTSCGKGDGNVNVLTSDVVRRYYIAAVEKKWNFSPNTIHPLSLQNYSDPKVFGYSRVQHDSTHIGSIYTKTLYREFTDSTFTTEKVRGASDIHLGVLGPFIRAEVGDTIEVVFKNMATRPFSIHPQGLLYNKSNEGMAYNDSTLDTVGDSVGPGKMHTYTWVVSTSSGPGTNGPNCVGSMYHSGVNFARDILSGLVGPLVICRRGTLSSEGKRRDKVDKEYAVLFSAFNENESWYLKQNVLEYAPSADLNDDDFIESNKYDSVNGYIYANVPNLVASVGENIAWYVLAVGEDEDIHTVHFHGQTYVYRSDQAHTGDVIEVFPGTYETVEMFAENPGTWLIHCHVSEHVRDGMVALYTIM